MEIHKFDPSDPEGVQWFKGWLERNHYKNIQIPTNPYSPYDIEADKDSKHYIFELKNRPCTSYAFNDSIIELQKFNILRWYDGEIQVVNFFYDCFYVNHIMDDHEFQTHYAQRTNNWSRDKVKKILVSYKHKEENKHNYNDI